MKLLILLLLPTIVFAKVKTERITYEKNGVKMEGFLAWNEKVKQPAPGIVVFHEWMGLGSHAENSAKQLAELGYVAFAADVFGVGIRPKNVEEAKAESSKYKSDRKLMRERALAALEVLQKNKNVNKEKLAAIGYCFGGTTALELAREGAPLKSVVSFHGGLSTPMKATKMSPKVLILHGGDDPFVPVAEVTEFEEEMRKSGADWQVISYGNTVHSFTNPDAGNDSSKGAAYNKKSATRAWEQMKNFFKETL